MIAKVLEIPEKAALQIVMTGDGSYSITQVQSGMTNPGRESPPRCINPGGAARGMPVRGGPPNKDGVLLKAMHGELVVPTHMVNAGAVDHLRGKIKGFAAGAWSAPRTPAPTTPPAGTPTCSPGSTPCRCTTSSRRP